jgi:hypothetical protein
MWALGFARKGKIVCEIANEFSCTDFLNWQIFSKVRPEKYGFFPYKVCSGFLHFLAIFDQNIKICALLVYIQLFYPFWRKRLPIPI